MHLGELLNDLVRGEDREIPRFIDLTPIAPDTLSKAWLTVKRDPLDDDEDAIFQKEITDSLTADGLIDDVGSGDPLTAHLYFLIPSDDSLLLEAGIYYYYDIKGLSAGGAKKVLEGGRIVAVAQITQSES